MSQLSDIYPSLFYEVDPLDNTSCFSLDNLQVFTFDILSSSQQIITPTINTSFLLSHTIPESLQRVGPHRTKEWILYSEMNKDDFVTWWVGTQAGTLKKKIRWNGEGHLLDIWKDFNQVAYHLTGEAKIMCQQCGKILEHPNHQSTRTKSLRRHILRTTCQKSGGAK
jgi:hypothetical protein